MKNRWIMVLLPALVMGIFAVSCEWDEEEYDGSFFDPGRGTLEFYADGEEFIRDGFMSMDGWTVEFNHVYVNVENVWAEQSSGLAPASAMDSASDMEPAHAGHEAPDAGSAGYEIRAPLHGSFFVDLHDQTGPTLIGTVNGVIAGNYDSIDFSMLPATLDSDTYGGALDVDLQTAAAEGLTMIIEGTALFSGNGILTGSTLNFTLKLDEQMEYVNCGPNQGLGFVSNGGVGEAYLTFHIDHIFGDYEETPHEGVNAIALGVDPIARACDSLGRDPVCTLTQTEMKANMTVIEYNTFMGALLTLGHSGEGHCHLAE